MDCHLPTIRSVNPKSALAPLASHFMCCTGRSGRWFVEANLRTWCLTFISLKMILALSLGGKKVLYLQYSSSPKDSKDCTAWAPLEPWPQEIRRSHDMNVRDLPRLTYLRLKVSCFGSKSMLSSVPMEAQSWAFTRIGGLHSVTHQMGRYPIQNREYWPRIISWLVAQFGFVWNFGFSANIWQF